VSEMRTIAADELWASPHYRRDSIAVHFTWHLEPAAVAAACVEVERTLAPFSPRRHWGKAFGASGATVTDSVPRLDDFLKLRDELDPSGKFVNPWFREKLLSTP
jgi:xylitol oxidase